MNEQDLTNKIKEQTQNLPIPDSISPENMKNMLDETLPEHTTPDRTDASVDAGVKPNTKYKTIGRFSAAACVALLLAGGIGVSLKLHNRTALDSPAETASSADSPESTDASTDQTDLAYQTSFHTPDSYDAYFDTVKEAYDAYYDRISNVVTNDVSVYKNADMDIPETASVESSADSGTATAKQSASDSTDFSQTNTQEDSIDEGDVVKTDGSYIYRIRTQYDDTTYDTTTSLTITKADNGTLTPITSISLNDLAKKTDDLSYQDFYLVDNHAILLYTIYDYTSNTNTKSYIAIYDVSDPEEPVLLKNLSQSGWYESSRISNGYLYTITNYTDCDFTDKKNYESYIPYVDDQAISCENIYYSDDLLMNSSYVITSLKLSDPSKFTDSKSIPMEGSSVYVSDNSIYLYASLYDTITKTEILKVDYADGALTVRNSAIITGSLYGPFAINEYDGYLRIVATIPANNISLLREAAVFEDDSSSGETVREDVNALYILDDQLNLTGKLTGIAPDEIIYSARFMGTTGYFVTYKNTDPLFSVDLSDPANPQIIGTLKIPGFSNYLHPYGEDILLGLGEETDPKTQESSGLKLSMFNISDPANVTEEDKYIIKDSWYSDAQYNYKAMMIDTDKNIFGFLYYIDSRDENNLYNNGAYYYVTYTYDKKDGFVETGKYEIKDGSEYESDGVRGIYIGDYLYITTNRQIISYELNTNNKIDTITLP